jgi:membrane protease YdiL (CAAX protease family)
VIALLLPPLVWLTGMGISALLGGGFPFNPILFASFPAILLANLGEEIGWRGFAYPRLQGQFSPLRASLILGVLWGLIHIPLNLQFPYLIFAVALLTAMAVIMTWIWNNTLGSVLVMTLFHCSLDVMQFVSPFGQTSDPVRAYAVIVALMWLVAGVVVWRTQGRLGAVGNVASGARSEE